MTPRHTSAMPRLLYTFILYLLTPLVLLRLGWRGLRAPAYWRRWPERFGFFAPCKDAQVSQAQDAQKRPPCKDAQVLQAQDAQEQPPCMDGSTSGVASLNETVWIHAVSVGETQAALPLIKALQQRYPHMTLVVTTTTPTGSERVRAALGDTVFHVYAPYDLPDAVQRFLQRTRPRMAIIMETELWPNLIHICQQCNIPVIVANARLSARSATGYQRVASLTRPTLQDITMITAQAQADAQRFIALGADPARVRVIGNIKFDITPAADLQQHAAALRQMWGQQRPVWIAASTHANSTDSEDEQVLAAFAVVRHAFPDTLLILVPRHPERFAKVTALCRKAGYDVGLRSEPRSCNANTDIYIGDSMGELMLFYAASDVAFVGGSLIAHGGHNLLEPAALGIPVITGPHTFNFADISRMLLQADAARQVDNAAELAAAVIDYLQNATLRHATSEKGPRLVEQNRGALAQLMTVIGECSDGK